MGVGYHLTVDYDEEITIGHRANLAPEVLNALEREIDRCPDVAFAHLPEVFVPGRQDRPEPVLFVWLNPEALRSLRSALDLVSVAVSKAMPDKEYLDVVVLNSAPELLERIENADCLLVKRDSDERRRAVEAVRNPPVEPIEPRSPWWWPFGSRGEGG
jgi:hypothetical protein